MPPMLHWCVLGTSSVRPGARSAEALYPVVVGMRENTTCTLHTRRGVVLVVHSSSPPVLLSRSSSNSFPRNRLPSFSTRQVGVALGECRSRSWRENGKALEADTITARSCRLVLMPKNARVGNMAQRAALHPLLAWQADGACTQLLLLVYLNACCLSRRV